jgi:Sec-independent protein translocase protein TatA
MFEDGEVALILVFALLFLKPEELVKLARELGRLYWEFRKAVEGVERDTESDLERLLELLGGKEGVRENGESSSPRMVQETVVSSSPIERRDARG